MSKLIALIAVVAVGCGGADSESPDAGGEMTGDAGALADAGPAPADACPLDVTGDEDPDFQIDVVLDIEALCMSEEVAQPAGILDLGLTTGYFISLRTLNQHAEMIVLHSAWVAVDDGTSCQPAGGREIEQIASLPPSASSFVDFIAIDAATGSTLSPGTIYLTVALEGTHLGSPIKSAPIVFEIEVCEGCLQNDLGACDAVNPPFEDPCLVGQDEMVDCCTDLGGDTHCPPPSSVASGMDV